SVRRGCAHAAGRSAALRHPDPDADMMTAETGIWDMTIDRVATNSQSQYLLSQIMQAENNLNTTQAQVTSGNVSSQYSGYGDKTAVLEATRSAENRVTGYQTATTNALTQ